MEGEDGCVVPEQLLQKITVEKKTSNKCAAGVQKGARKCHVCDGNKDDLTRHCASLQLKQMRRWRSKFHAQKTLKMSLN